MQIRTAPSRADTIFGARRRAWTDRSAERSSLEKRREIGQQGPLEAWLQVLLAVSRGSERSISRWAGRRTAPVGR